MQFLLIFISLLLLCSATESESKKENVIEGISISVLIIGFVILLFAFFGICCLLYYYKIRKWINKEKYNYDYYDEHLDIYKNVHIHNKILDV